MSKYLLAIGAACAALVAVPSGAQHYKTEVFIPGSGMHGIHGIAFDSEDRMFVGSVVGQSIFEINAETGQQRPYIEPPNGMADDLEFAEDGTLFWTSFALGKIHAQKNFGPTREIANALPGINSLAFNAEGRLFATQVFLGDALYEIDPMGKEYPRKIMENIGGLNGFDFGPDGYLYGPLWFKGSIAKIDVDAGTLETVVDGFKVPAAANFDAEGNLWVLDSAAGQIVKVDVEKRTREIFPGMPTSMDNLAFDSQDQLWFTVMAENAVYRFDETTREAVMIRRDEFAQPCDLHIVQDGERELLYVADNFSVKVVDLATKEVVSLARNVESNIQYPSGLFVNDDHVLVTSWFSNTLQRLDRRTGEELELYAGIQRVSDVVEMDDGRILALVLNGRLHLVEGFQVIAWPTLATVHATPTAMTYAGGSRVYISSTAGGSIYELDVDSGKSKMIIGGLQQPEGLCLTPEGDALVFIEVGKQTVSRVDLTTGEIQTLGVDIPSGLRMPQFLPESGPLSGVAVASDGSVYVTSDVDGSIYKLTPIDSDPATD